MQNPEALFSTWRAGALVFVDGLIRPAAFVYQTADGLAWIEPSVADPQGAATPALHFRAGQLIDEPGGGVRVVESGVVVLPYGDDADLIGDALEWFARWLSDTGANWDDQREALRPAPG